MSERALPLIIDPDHLNDLLGEEGLLVVDLCRAETYRDFHIPGAVHLDYPQIIHAEGKAMGLLPDEAMLGAVLSSIGMTPDSHVVAYDDEGGGKAARLLWTLELIGHPSYALLNGGLHAWANEGFKLDRAAVTPVPSQYPARYVDDAPALADRDWIMAHLDDPSVALLDARSPQEYEGVKRFAEHGGHIPGALNLEWTLFMDQGHNMRLRDEETLRNLLDSTGFSPKQTIVAYCQTHHRSAFSWYVLNALGYQAKGYPGSWSDWGNRDDTPIEA